MNRLRALRIGTRLTVSTIVTVLFLLFVGGVGLFGATRQSNLQHRLDAISKIVDQAEALRYQDADVSGWQGYIFAEAKQEGPRVATDPNDYNLKGLADSKAATYQVLDNFHQRELTAAERAQLTEIRGTWDRYFALTDTMIAKIRTGTPASIASAYDILNNPLDKIWSELLDQSQHLQDSLVARMHKATNETHQAAHQVRTMILIAMGLLLVVSVTVSNAIARSITRPLARAVATTKKVANGDLTATVGESYRDEVGQLSVALDETTSTLRTTISEMSTSANALVTAAQGMSSNSERMARSAESGASLATQSASSSTLVAANVQTVAAATNEMEASIREIAGSAAAGSDVANEAVRLSSGASDSVQQLSVSATEIDEVIGLITGIAGQTRLLALNAQIEAARAGDSGSGFAVVAREVKDLANESEKAAQSIAARITGVQDTTSTVVSAISDIAGVIDRISELQLSIASSVEQQSMTTAEMGRNLTEAATGAEQIASVAAGVADAAATTQTGAGETSRGAQELTAIASDLNALVARFTI